MALQVWDGAATNDRNDFFRQGFVETLETEACRMAVAAKYETTQKRTALSQSCTRVHTVISASG